MKKKILLVVSSVFLAILVGGIIGEVFIRFTFPYWDLNMALKYSPSIFSRHIIDRRQKIVHRRSDPSDTIAINTLGYRGDPVKFLKSKNQTRIMIYGGSQVFSIDTGKMGWPEMVEKLLKKRGFKKVEVINAGTPGHASFDSLGRLFSFGHFLKPDVVILDNQWNDLKYFHVRQAPLTEVRPYNPQANPRRNYVNGLDQFLGEHLQFYLILREMYLSFNTNPRRSQDFYRPGKSSQISRQALMQYSLTVQTFVNVVRSIGAKPVLMRQPRLLTKNLSEANKKKIGYGVQNLEPETLLKAYSITDRILRRTAKSPDVYWFNPSRMNGKSRYFYDHVHLTPRGARELAKRLSEFLEAEVL